LPTALIVGVVLIAVVAMLVLLLPRLAPTDGAAASPSSMPTSSDPGLGSATPTPDTSIGPPPTPTPSPTPSPAPPSVLVGAGDIADCSSTDDSLTAALLDSVPGTVFTAGDNAYGSGTAKQFATCYDETWGRHRDRTRPATGNHDWRTADLAGYFGYFGATAQGPGGTPWYSYELGSWHVIVLDSECAVNSGCEADSAQGRWLAADLAASTADCTVAIWHKPRFSSGDHGNSKAGASFWTALHAAGADLVLNGHDHDYERFAPQDPAGAADPINGIRQFVVGTGGKSLRAFGNIKDHSEVRLVEHGVLQLTLHDGSYEWAFLSVTGDVPDRGTGACH
jgi:hypothetical protein